MKWSLALLPAVLVAGCAGPGTMYEWGGYQPALLSHTKSGDTAKFEEELLETIERGERKEAVPPGVYAELGYLLLNSNRASEAVVYFQKEKATFPESSLLMDKMIFGAERASEGENGDAS